MTTGALLAGGGGGFGFWLTPKAIFSPSSLVAESQLARSALVSCPRSVHSM